MDMKFFESPTCPDCPAAKKNVKEVLAKLKLLDALKFFDISTPDGRIEALNNMVMGTPAMMIGEELLTKEVLLDRKRLEDVIRNNF